MINNKTKTIEIRWHGRGGQGAVTSAELVALAAISENRFAQAMPSFGPERRGAPVLAFNRINDTDHIRTRAAVVEPDIVVVLDSGLLQIIDIAAGMKQGGVLIINTPKSLDEIKSEFGGPWKIAAINATAIARETLGVPIVNTTMIGALVKATNLISLESLEEPLKERFGPKAKNNIEACNKAYREVAIIEPATVIAKQNKTFQTEIMPSWQELLPGCVVTEPGNASTYKTGDWRSQYPKFDYEQCNKCGLCYIYCPEACIMPNEDGYFEANMFYCKGCGICAVECPKNVITMIEEF